VATAQPACAPRTRCGDHGLAAEAGCEERQREQKREAEDDGNDAQRRLVDLAQRLRRLEPRGNQREVVERRAVVLGAVVAVHTVFEQHAELDRVHGFVGMHRSSLQVGDAQRDGNPDDGQKDQRVERPGDT